jgi:hypothetical protein
MHYSSHNTLISSYCVRIAENKHVSIREKGRHDRLIHKNDFLCSPEMMNINTLYILQLTRQVFLKAPLTPETAFTLSLF